MLGLFTNHVFVMFLTIILLVFILNRQCLLLWSSTGAKFSLLESLLIFLCHLHEFHKFSSCCLTHHAGTNCGPRLLRKIHRQKMGSYPNASFDTIYNLVQNFSSRAMLNFVATSSRYSFETSVVIRILFVIFRKYSLLLK